MIRAGWLTTGKMVIYPVANLADGRQLVNWVAEIETPHHTARDWNRRGEIGDFIGAFADWHFDWLDVPALIRAAESILEFPMVDQEPLPWWSRGRVTLMGDAAHPMYPRGSNGAGQAILDARALADALARYDDPVAALALRSTAAARHGGGRAHESQQSAGRHPARSVRAHGRQAVRADRGRHQPRRARRDVRSLQARRGPCPIPRKESDHETRAGRDDVRNERPLQRHRRRAGTVSEPPGQGDRSVHARDRHRHPRAYARSEAVRRLEAACRGGESCRSERQYRHRSRRQVAPGRLHAPDDREHDRAQPKPVQDDSIRSRQGFRPRRAAGARAPRAGRASFAAVQRPSRSSSRWPRRARASSTMRRPATGRRIILRWSSSSRRPRSTSCTCRTRGPRKRCRISSAGR